MNALINGASTCERSSVSLHLISQPTLCCLLQFPILILHYCIAIISCSFELLQSVGQVHMASIVSMCVTASMPQDVTASLASVPVKLATEGTTVRKVGLYS